ncbi:unnamed protein product [Symbiodinium sp. CCMP2456]|nr:unnamed protein product [Symbiodinium sp. CCMP2456]
MRPKADGRTNMRCQACEDENDIVSLWKNLRRMPYMVSIRFLADSIHGNADQAPRARDARNMQAVTCLPLAPLQQRSLLSGHIEMFVWRAFMLKPGSSAEGKDLGPGTSRQNLCLAFPHCPHLLPPGILKIRFATAEILWWLENKGS